MLFRSIPSERRARWAGTYRIDSGLLVEVVERGEQLWIVVQGQADRRLLWQGERECRVQGNDALRVAFDEEGERVVGLTYHDDDGTPHVFARVE